MAKPYVTDDNRVMRVDRDDPTRRDVHALLEAHLAFARAVTPPDEVHALDADGRTADTIEYFTVRTGAGVLLAVGAVQRLDDRHYEVKSMHTAETARRRGAGRLLLDRLIDEARAVGATRLSLETGAMDAFAPSRALYAAAGFERCEPYGQYGPNSYCMTMEL